MDFLKDATEILCTGTNDRPRDVHLILEDAESPITRKMIENLYQAIMEKGHVDFDTIPKSAGDITKYSGYETMMNTLNTLRDLASENPAYKDLAQYVNDVVKAIGNIALHKPEYSTGFSGKNQMLILEYNTFVFTCVEATTSLLYQFADFLKTPSSDVLKIALKNTKYRADLFYIEQLRSFNHVCQSGNYKKYLKGILSSGTKNFFLLDDAMAVGTLAIITTVMLSIIPITRRLIYTIQDFRGRLADDLELQAYFLEMNQNYLKANKTRTVAENKKIMEKQEKVRLKFLRLADKLRVSSVRAEELARKTLNNEDRTMSVNSLQDDVSNSDITIL